MDSKPDVSVIIVNYNVKDLLLTCLRSVYSFTINCSFEVIVVDNNSTDGSVEAIKSNFPSVVLISNKYNAGFPAANNQGLNIANGEFVFLLNPDTELIEDSLTQMLVYLRSHPEITLVAPKLLNSDRSLQRSVFRFPRISFILAEMLYLERFTAKKYYNEKNFNEIFEIDSAAGAALFFRKQLVNEIGMLNEKLFWIEDIEFCFRIHRNGGRIIYFPNTRLIHYSGHSARKNYNVSISNQVINKIKFYKLHGNVFSLLLIYLLSIINVILRFMIFLLLTPFRRIYFLKMKAYWYTFPKIFSATREL